MPKRKVIYDPSGRAEKMRTRHDLHRSVLQHLYPSATHVDHTTTLDKLTKILCHEASSGRCVATTLDGFRCTNGITLRSCMEAMKMTNELGSDAIANENFLLAAAQLLSCRQSRVDHQRQASITVFRWTQEAQKAEFEVMRARIGVLAESLRVRERYLGEAGRFEDVEDEEEGGDEVESEAQKAARQVPRARARSSGTAGRCYVGQEDDEEREYVMEEVVTPWRKVPATGSARSAPSVAKHRYSSDALRTADKGTVFKVE
ncbi:hypothetical protein EJ03DRAFT_33669 [Teratosphaeria nubilosa]|uniref:Uncharacterized protein n=1 Tax=Teratosphaeria nubilosa TaxID=161662 RepID=A0A6G1KUK1_9PEZI|nr:hypothetical protein EJ03DRAFT_33669 [Teratosphaeria nubilosa]